MDLNRQIEYRISTGSGSTVAQSFFSNKNVFVKTGLTNVNIFESPQYISYGGTEDYYGQDPYSIFTNLNVPFIRFVFTGNTFSVSGETEFVNRVYKLDFETYKNYNTALTPNDKIQNVVSGSTTEKVTVTDQNGNQTTTSTEKITTSTTDSQDSTSNSFTSRGEIQELLENPYLEHVTPATGMTFPSFDFVLSQYIKASGTTSGAYKKELFEDKSQYFVESFFRFRFPTPEGDYDTNKISFSGNNEILLLQERDTEFYPSYFTQEFSLNNSGVSINYGNFSVYKYPTFSSVTYEDIPPRTPITSDTFQDIVVGGSFFSFFTVPNKPTFENPLLQGPQNTFSPKVYFSNVEDGDSYVVEVTYDLSDTGFTNGKQVFNIEKQPDTQNGIQTATFSIKTNSQFRYRVGNVKVLRNIFDVDQKITTFSEQLTGSTQVNPPETYVFTEIDSPFTTTISTPTPPPSILFQNSGNYTLSGSVSGSTVTGATISLQYQNSGNTLTLTADSIGNFSFSGLTSGTYTLTTQYRGYETDVRNIYINSNLAYGYIIQIFWDNEFDTWGSKENDIILF